MELKLHPHAEDDLKEALKYYNEIDKNLSSKFINTLDFTFDKILQNQKLYPYETTTTQRVLMGKFPYIIIYEHYQNIIMILAIFHTSRDPNKLEKRK